MLIMTDVQQATTCTAVVSVLRVAIASYPWSGYVAPDRLHGYTNIITAVYSS